MISKKLMMNSFQHEKNDAAELEKNEDSEQLYRDMLHSVTYHANSIIDIL
jgi:hypothetical protein